MRCMIFGFFKRVSELLAALDVLPFFDCSMDATDHHSTNTYGHDVPKGRAVNGDDLAHICAIDVESRSDGLGRQVYRGLIPDHHT